MTERRTEFDPMTVPDGTSHEQEDFQSCEPDNYQAYSYSESS